MSESSANSSLVIENEEEKPAEEKPEGAEKEIQLSIIKKLTKKPTKPGLWGTAAKLIQTPNTPAKVDDTSEGKRSLKSVAKRVNRQIKAQSLIKRWTKMTQHGQFAKNEQHLNYMRDVAENSVVELPEPLVAVMRDEVCTILQDTLRQYKIELGNHELTQEMQENIQKMKEEVAASSGKDIKRDQTFFRKLSTVFVTNTTAEKP